MKPFFNEYIVEFYQKINNNNCFEVGYVNKSVCYSWMKKNIFSHMNEKAIKLNNCATSKQLSETFIIVKRKDND